MSADGEPGYSVRIRPGHPLRDAAWALGQRHAGLSGAIWQVVGGEDRGGVLARSGPDLASPKLPERISTGALLFGLELSRWEAAGERLRFLRLTGAGPEEGWASLALNHKTLVEPVGVVLGTALPQLSPQPDARRRRGPGGGEPPAREGGAAEVQTVPAALKDPSEALLHRLKASIRHVPGALSDLDLFDDLQAELDETGRWKPPGGMAWIDNRWKKEPDSGSWASAFVLRMLSETINADLDVWWANLYEDGSACCDFHQDGHREQDGVTVSASFGAERDITFLHTETGLEFSFHQENGDIFAFNRWVDSAFMHRVYPAPQGIVGSRISIIMMGRTRVWDGGPPGGLSAAQRGAAFQLQGERDCPSQSPLEDGALQDGHAPPPEAATALLREAIAKKRQGTATKRSDAVAPLIDPFETCVFPGGPTWDELVTSRRYAHAGSPGLTATSDSRT